jgi:hypothetical protein
MFQSAHLKARVVARNRRQANNRFQHVVTAGRDADLEESVVQDFEEPCYFADTDEEEEDKEEPTNLSQLQQRSHFPPSQDTIGLTPLTKDFGIQCHQPSQSQVGTSQPTTIGEPFLEEEEEAGLTELNQVRGQQQQQALFGFEDDMSEGEMTKTADSDGEEEEEYIIPENTCQGEMTDTPSTQQLYCKMHKAFESWEREDGVGKEIYDPETRRHNRDLVRAFISWFPKTQQIPLMCHRLNALRYIQRRCYDACKKAGHEDISERIRKDKWLKRDAGHFVKMEVKRHKFKDLHARIEKMVPKEKELEIIDVLLDEGNPLNLSLISRINIAAAWAHMRQVGVSISPTCLPPGVPWDDGASWQRQGEQRRQFLSHHGQDKPECPPRLCKFRSPQEPKKGC